MPISTSSPDPSERLVEGLRERARDLGFCECRIAAASLPAVTGERLASAIAEGHHAGMGWLAETLARRQSPRAMWPQARSAVMLAMDYGPAHDPLADLEARDRGVIAAYARNRDYHELIKGRLKQLAGWLASRSGSQVKVFVDTAPLMEKPLAQGAGLGWQGKHTNLVSRRHGSWLLLGAILTDADLPADVPETDHCGSCRRCLDICPTQAFPAPYRLDARRCISYLTIEHHGPIPRALRPAIGNRIFGCDDCLAVCPWNRFASLAREAGLVARADNDRPTLAGLAGLDEAAFRARFSGSPIKRTGHARFLRNVLIALGNSGEAASVAAVLPHLDAADPVVRGAAVWALSRLLSPTAFAARREAARETDPTVVEEWAAGSEAA